MSDYKLYIEFTKIAEGGLSKAKTDEAHKYPVPDGSGYHTNKGVTWTTFKRLGSILGYNPTPALFYQMPEWLFLKIFKHFWDSAKANLINSQAMANIIFQSLWGGGYKTLITDIQSFLKLKGYSIDVDGGLGTETAKAINNFSIKNERELYDYTHQKRLEYLRSRKSYKDNGKGWESRMEKLKEFANILIQKIKKKSL